MRTETDSLGPVAVPDEALWGAQTQRAVHNFPISGLRQPDIYLRVTAMVKQAAAEVNVALGQLDPALGAAIAAAAAEIVAGRWHEQFVVDPFQAGAGTSHNMNANEVIANLANEALGGQRGTYRPVHPNDHVNMAQSTNDVIPTVVRVAAALLVRDLLPVIEALADALERKAQAFDAVLKPGRTHLQDAVPVRLGQGSPPMPGGAPRWRARAAAEGVHRLGIGGTARARGSIRTPIPRRHGGQLSALAGIAFHSSGNLFESMQAPPTWPLGRVAYAGVDPHAHRQRPAAPQLRPTTDLGEITLPAVSRFVIMPGR